MCGNIHIWGYGFRVYRRNTFCYKNQRAEFISLQLDNLI